jgi:hypothetical protein
MIMKPTGVGERRDGPVGVVEGREGGKGGVVEGREGLVEGRDG